METFVINQNHQISLVQPNHSVIIRYRHGYVEVLEIAGGVSEILEAHRAFNPTAAHNIINALKEEYLQKMV
jgi:hypothetical protein